MRKTTAILRCDIKNIFPPILLFTYSVFGQSATEVFLLDIVEQDSAFTILNPINISNNIGYDNQPSFINGGRDILFSSTRNGQTDIVRYNIRRKTKTWLTETEGSEYSPIQIGSSQSFSTILLEKNGTQLLYKYSMKTGLGEVLIPTLKIGYHTWINRYRVISFVLGDPPSLHLSDLKARTNRIVDDSIGRSLHRIPRSDLISYISKKKNIWEINAYDPNTGKIDFITQALGKSEDVAWTPNGTLITGEGSKIYKFSPHSGWIETSDLSNYNLTNITRIAVSPRGDRVAIVVAEVPCLPKTIFLLRHAEKEIKDDENDVDLTIEGHLRSKAFALMMKDVKQGFIYSTQYKRTLQTITPLEEVWSIKAKVLPAQNPKELTENLLKNHCDQNVVVVGHSNTLPELIALLGIKEEITINDDQYGDLFIIKWSNGLPIMSIKYVGK